MSYSTSAVTVSGVGSNWTNFKQLHVGYFGNGTLEITNGGAVSNTDAYIGWYSRSASAATVSGAGSTWTNFGTLYIGYEGDCPLDITNGGAVSNTDGYIGYDSRSTSVVTVDGVGSTWANSGDLYVGYEGEGTLNIAAGGLVSVGGGLTIDYDGGGDSFITMATRGMLALSGDADDLLGDFLGLIDGTDDIRYWDDSVSDWADITGGTRGVDYTLEYLTEGDLAGYTLLTVPEPATLSILALGGLALLRRRNRLETTEPQRENA